MGNIRNYVIDYREENIKNQIESLLADLGEKGLSVEFGKIGERSTYALIYNEDHSIEYVGYTFLKNMKHHRESIGKLKSLEQALARISSTAE